VSEMEDLLAAVTDVARIAGAIALESYGKGIEVEIKRDGSPVTAADRAAEVAAREWLARFFPDDEIVGEEFGASEPSGARRRWLIDPIDGTKSYVAGVPLWGTLIAVAEGERVLAGAINCAAAGELVAAARGAGAWRNGVRCRVSSIAKLEEATILTTDPQFRGFPERRAAWDRLADRARVVRCWGDCYGYLLVATGRADVMVDDRMNAWDSAALEPIIIEAGGVFTDWRNRPTAFGGDSIATNAALSNLVRDVLCS